MAHNGSPIQLHPQNPRYFLYEGQPLVLITATEHYGAVINRNFDYVAYLDEAADKRATLSRCFLLFRELEHYLLNPHSSCKPIPSEYIAPYLRAGPGYATDGYPKFDLDQWNPEYFTRLHGFLGAASQRGIVVELTLFSNTYADAIWKLNPLNSENNVQGIGAIAWQNYLTMRDQDLFEHQLAYVQKIVREVNHYDNIYFEVCNEPFGDYPDHASAAEVEAWHDAIRSAIREVEFKLPKRHLIFQVAVERSRVDNELDRLVDEPTIDAINIHDYQQLSYRGHVLPPLARFMQGDLRLWRINYLWTVCHSASKPIIFDEDNAATSSLDEEAWTIHRKRAWTTVFSGGHYNMIDFSIQSSGQEAGSPAARAHIRTWLKHLSTFMHAIDFVRMVPIRDFCAKLPEATLAATLANPGEEYVIYLADKREKDERGVGEPCAGSIEFALPAGRYDVRMYSPASGNYTDQSHIINGGPVTIALKSFTHDTVLHIIAG